METPLIRSILSVVLVLVALVICCPTAHAVYLYNWDTVQRIDDPVGDSGNGMNPGQDIVGTWGTYDAATNTAYFRIDLMAAAGIYNGYATTYGIYIDNRPGGASSGNTYIPSLLPSSAQIDMIVKTDLCFYGTPKNGRLMWDRELGIWKEDGFKWSDGIKFQHSMNGGKTLEWAVKDNGSRDLTLPLYWWAASFKATDPGITYDITSKATTTPIPGGIWLLGSGIVLLTGLRRRETSR